jgi:hypothetical protein
LTDAHQSKKRAMLRALEVAGDFEVCTRFATFLIDHSDVPVCASSFCIPWGDRTCPRESERPGSIATCRHVGDERFLT